MAAEGLLETNFENELKIHAVMYWIIHDIKLIKISNSIKNKAKHLCKIIFNDPK